MGLDELGPGEEALLDGSLTLPSIPGVHELQAVYIADPYESLLAGADPIVTGSPAVAAQRLVIASDEGVVYCFGSQSQ